MFVLNFQQTEEVAGANPIVIASTAIGAAATVGTYLNSRADSAQHEKERAEDQLRANAQEAERKKEEEARRKQEEEDRKKFLEAINNIAYGVNK